MKNDALMYEKIYEILKYKIECGVLPGGAKLPSRAKLCREFQTSEKTIRRAVTMLARDGLVETTQRKCPTVALRYAGGYKNQIRTLQRADSGMADDILKTGILLCYPLNKQGMILCTEKEWATPEAIIENMDPDKPVEFWQLSNRFWRFFISRNENQMALRAVDSLGLAELNPSPGTFEIRSNYRAGLKELVETMKRGGEPENVHFDDLFVLYGFMDRNDMPDYHVSPESPMRVGTKVLEQRLRKAQERYSSVYLDILGLIAVGRYQPGDRLPSHEELRRIYGVSVDTTTKAIQILRDWGVVTTTRGKGIFVAMNLDGLKKIQIDPELIASHVRRFLDSLELLSLTVKGVAIHIAPHVTEEEAQQLYDKIYDLQNEHYLYQISPIILLEFLVRHIQYDAMRVIYELVEKDYHLGRSIPKLVNRKKTPASYGVYQQCMDAVKHLLEGDHLSFAEKTEEMFQNTHRMIISECKRLGYWEDAMRVYDGSLLWK